MSNETYRQFDPWRPSPVKEISRHQIAKTHYFSIDRVSYESNDGGQFDRYCLYGNVGDTVGVLALTKDGMIPLVEQYRLASHRWTLEIPGGHAVDSAEPTQDLAKRKLIEEGGYEAGRITQFARFLNTPSYSTQHTSLYLATDLTPTKRQEIGPETPRSEVRLTSLDDAYQMVLNGTIVDAKTIIAILRLKSGSLEQLND
ncbi:NUDIX domain-containing protein [Bifidobacterium callitrichidarum]|uniref:NUDIX hydrolase n=1 Tax=Bifidobacterium callitrichidarum TaxID=2052941 RepID=A0A2U2MZG6_9BIFI|nr:NUDIX hydrolase [Bifidobacterium callitrichidarum]PWG62193.1 NUDIX hydrolase [Bifidobacterium callitrichidarum]